MFSKTTHKIKVTVEPEFLADYSEPIDEHYVWAYTVQVENGSDQTLQLVERHWDITDASGQMQVVEGEGVVGEQPILLPGEGFKYTSGTALPTPSGIMVGRYRMQADDGSNLDIDIPAFSLDSPYQIERPN
ncbi:MAG: Co2+/Mg2+ efflux protein ApaG [Rickettsiales bacterium]|nr:Co2+/Mg2+ efflux protein ApaG [Rickettsiales bacterium]